ncbi:MAG: DUF6155 family protein [Eubacteriales bacterium]|nr:DUF6155 family protein [Eubacteriales bacterium]
MSKLTNSALKKCLRSLSWDALEDIISTLYKDSEQVHIYMNMRFNAEGYSTELLEMYKTKIKRCFPLKDYGDCKTAEAHRYVKEMMKMSLQPFITLDVMLYFVECGNAFTQEVGDIDSRFYDSLLSVYCQFIERMNALEDDTVYLKLKDRVDALVVNSRNIGWGYSDGIEESTSEIIWKDD